MRIISLQLAFLASSLAIAFTGAGRAGEIGPPAVSTQELNHKIEFCSSCHQPSGQGYGGFSPIPRLAGQQTEYFENQLQAFIERRRKNAYMVKVTHDLTPAMRTALAAHFKSLNPKPVGKAPTKLLDLGKTIYTEGVPAADVPACASCHGAEAKGDAAIPRLAGQIYPYTINALVNWSEVRGQDPANPDTSAIMQPIAHNLTRSQIEAVAAYIGYLE